MPVDRFKNLLLLRRLHSDGLECLSCSAVRADKRFVVLSGKRRSAVVGPAAQGADRHPDHIIILHIRIPPCIYRRRQPGRFIKAEGVVPFQANPHVEIAWNPNRPVLMHYVGKSCHRPALPRADAFVLKPDVPFVVEIGESLIAVEGGFIRSRHLPDYHGNRAAGAFLDREVGAGLAPLEQQFPTFEICRAEDRSVRAAHPHLRDIEVAAISNVVSFSFMVSILSEGVTLLPP